MKFLFTILLSVMLLAASDEYYAKIRDTLVKVESERGGYGSGVVVKSDSFGSYVITDKHVCLSEKLSQSNVPGLRTEDLIMEYKLFIISKTSKLEVRGVGQVLKVAPSMELCLLWTSIPNLPIAKLATKNPEKGSKVFAYQYPFDENTKVSSKFDGYFVLDNGIFQKTYLGVRPGSSGSGVFNEGGELIGLIVGFVCTDRACTPSKQAFSHSTPLEFIKFFLHEVQ